MLTICPECGERVSDKANQCIHCGYPLSDLDTTVNNNICIINGIKNDVSWLIDSLSKYDDNQKEVFIKVLTNTVNKTQKERISYVAKLEKEDKLNLLHQIDEFAKEISSKTKLSFDNSKVFLFNVLLNEEIPNSFNGETIKEWSQKLTTQTSKPHCPHCQSTNIKKLSLTNKAISIGGFGILSNKIGKTFQCNDCKYTW